MGKATLVVMAAGIGSRYGGGIKQLEPVGPNGEIIMDYSIYDAMEAGFDKVVFVIRKDLEKDFKEVIGNRIEKVIESKYAFQEKDDIPEPYRTMYAERKKPWGTGQAILSCKDVVQEPFVVINSDDYYGKEAYVEAYQYLVKENHMEDTKLPACMIGFILGNTLSENGGVTRGICKVDEHGKLTEIAETKNILKTASGVLIQNEKGNQKIDAEVPVSMNMWGLYPEIFSVLEEKLEQFLSESGERYQEKEYLLPTIIEGLLEEKKIEVSVLKSNDRWFGVTYLEDKAAVVQSILELIEQGLYPSKLFE